MGRGMLIFLLAYGDMAEEAKTVKTSKTFRKVSKQFAPSYGDDGFPILHWTLVRNLTVTSDWVLIRVYSYGRAREAAFPLNQFLNIYQGYVMANPS